MDYELPSEFDLIVIGTGMLESVISAAASRIGKRVLHLDNANYYGGVWASFNLDTLNSVLSEKSGNADQKQIDVGLEKLLVDGERIIRLENGDFGLSNVKQEWHIPEKLESVETKQESEILEANSEKPKPEISVHTKENLLKDSRKFNLDLAPKLHFARGDFVELLISSNISRYAEFCSVSRVLTWLNDQLELVPCSRSDVFSNSKVTVIEKRMLMKLLTACLDGDEKELGGHDNKTFYAFLKERKLTDNLIHYVLYAISMSTKETSFAQGVENTKRFLNSLGRFGKTPFLFSLYGSGDITQAFCRLSAVFGGIYALNQPLQGLIVDEKNNVKSLICGGQRISAPHIVLAIDKAPKDFVKTIDCKNSISRGIFITDRSVLESEKENLTLLLFPPEGDKNSCVVLEVGYLTRTVPKDIVYIYTKGQKTPEDDIKHCAEKLFNFNNSQDSKKPNVLYSAYFSAPDTTKADLSQKDLPGNVFLCPGPDMDLDSDFTIKKAKDIFNKIYPGLEFLPRAPDPEEIIIGDETDDDGNTGCGDDGSDCKDEVQEEKKETGLVADENKEQEE